MCVSQPNICKVVLKRPSHCRRAGCGVPRCPSDPVFCTGQSGVGTSVHRLSGSESVASRHRCSNQSTHHICVSLTPGLCSLLHFSVVILSWIRLEKSNSMMLLYFGIYAKYALSRNKRASSILGFQWFTPDRLPFVPERRCLLVYCRPVLPVGANGRALSFLLARSNKIRAQHFIGSAFNAVLDILHVAGLLLFKAFKNICQRTFGFQQRPACLGFKSWYSMESRISSRMIYS